MQPNNQYLNQQPFGNRGPNPPHPGNNQFMRPQQVMGGQGPNNYNHPGHMQQPTHHNQGGQQYGGQNMGGHGQGYRKPQTAGVDQRGGRYPPRGNPGGFGNAPAKS